jgi:alkanesulfonate monooxygenase SsuD/methylene tetrahydromethanopterin reductase-like flavin-dependent oxidoreductase (luciferase family)
MRGLWTHEAFAFDGHHVSFPTVAREPRCFQRPHVPIWIGGIGRHVTRRIVEFGTGWGAPIPWPIDKLARRVTQIKHGVAEAGRDPDALRFAAGLSFGPPDPAVLTAFGHVGSQVTPEWIAESAEAALALVDRYQRAGFTDLVVSTEWRSPDEYVDKLAWFSEHVLAHVDPT